MMVAIAGPAPGWLAQSARRTAFRGFTLVELMIVVAVLAMVAAFSFPAMRRMSSRGQLADAAGKIRAEMGRARLEAIRRGTPRQFRFQPGGRRFEIASRTASVGGDLDLFGQFGGAADDGRSLEPATGRPAGDDVTLAELDQGVEFALDLSQISPSETGTAAAGGLDAAPDWSLPIVFYPNGRTLNAHFLLTDGRDYYVEVTLRGLTGAASVGPVTALPKQNDAYSEDMNLSTPLPASETM
jgi:prepilin-type N-terminal cleavage/methylation domain-containing protein